MKSILIVLFSLLFLLSFSMIAGEARAGCFQGGGGIQNLGFRGSGGGFQNFGFRQQQFFNGGRLSLFQRLQLQQQLAQQNFLPQRGFFQPQRFSNRVQFINGRAFFVNQFGQLQQVNQRLGGFGRRGFSIGNYLGGLLGGF